MKGDNMKLRFIGKDGSMNLKHGQVYEIIDISAPTFTNYIKIRWNDNGHLRSCPYSSLSALCANWSDVKGVL